MASHRESAGGAVATLILLGVFIVPASAQTTAATRFDACYVRGTGTVYRINAPGLKLVSCSRNDFTMPWTDGAGAVRSGDAAGGDLSGTFPNPLVAALRGHPIDAAAPTDGQELRFDQASGSWKPATPAEGVTDHGQLTGLTDDDHPQYLLADGARATSNGFAVTGTLNSGIVPVAGEGIRFMWFPSNAALRAGEVDGAYAAAWDQQSLGQFSVALGHDVTASAIASSALGSVSAASGDYSTAIGNNVTASGISSVAMGALSLASGIASFALGLSDTASGNYSTAMGYGASTATQEGSFVYGDHTLTTVVQASAPNQFVVRASGGFQFRTLPDLSTGCNLPAGSGSWDCTSSVMLKTDFEPVDGEDVLARVRQLPVQRWSYRGEPGVRHMGTFAEDFHREFGLGTSDKTIGMIDMDGVNLAAVQALERRTREQASEIAELRAELAALRAEIAQRRQ